MRTAGLGDSWWTPTKGVSPMSPRTSSWRMGRRPTVSAPRDGGEDRDGVAVGDGGVQLVQVPDVVVVAVDVHELVQRPAPVDQLAGETRVANRDLGEHLAHR